MQFQAVLISLLLPRLPNLNNPWLGNLGNLGSNKETAIISWEGGERGESLLWNLSNIHNI